MAKFGGLNSRFLKNLEKLLERNSSLEIGDVFSFAKTFKVKKSDQRPNNFPALSTTITPTRIAR